MIKDLVVKDFKLFFKSGSTLKKKISSLLTTILFALCFVGILLFMLVNILKKISIYVNAQEAFMVLCLEVISIILMFSFVIRANKLFFNKNDIELTSKFPIRNRDIIISKLIFLFLSYYFTALVFTYPMFIAYGIITKVPIWFYLVCLLYPVATFLIDMGLALILLCPYTLIKNKIKNSFVIRFILYLAILSVVIFLYSKVLSLYVNLVAGGDILVLFTQSTITKFQNIRKFELSSNPFISLFIEHSYKHLAFILINLVIFAIGVVVAILFYKHERNYSLASKPKKFDESLKESSVSKTLIKKELTILTKNENYIISFVCLLIIQPFLAYLIIYSLNLIFRTGMFSYYISMVPNFITFLDILILILFSLIINQGATYYISMEEKTISIMKMIPVSYKRQLIIKLLIPFTLSFLSFFITDTVLLIANVINVEMYLVSIILITLSLFIYDSICLYEELKIRSNKARNTFASNLYSYFLPFAYFIASIILALFKMNIYLIYLIGVGLIIVLGIYFVIKTFKNMEKDFILIESVRKKYN